MKKLWLHGLTLIVGILVPLQCNSAVWLGQNPDDPHVFAVVSWEKDAPVGYTNGTKYVIEALYKEGEAPPGSDPDYISAGIDSDALKALPDAERAKWLQTVTLGDDKIYTLVEPPATLNGDSFASTFLNAARRYDGDTHGIIFSQDPSANCYGFLGALFHESGSEYEPQDLILKILWNQGINYVEFVEEDSYTTTWSQLQDVIEAPTETYIRSFVEANGDVVAGSFWDGGDGYGYANIIINGVFIGSYSYPLDNGVFMPPPVDGKFLDVGINYFNSIPFVPEPPIYALMLAGLAGLGFIARCRKT